MYLSVQKKKPTGPHEVDFVIENGRDYFQNLTSQSGGGGGGITKTHFQTGGLLEGGLIANREGGA